MNGLYYKGRKLKATSSGYGSAPAVTSFTQGGTIGCNNKPGDNAYNFDFFKGNIDDIRIYNSVLSDDERAMLYTLREQV